MAQYLGTRLTLSPTSYLLTQSTTRQQVSTKAPIVVPSGGWITSIGVWARTVSGNSRLALGIWQQGSDALPGELLARTNPMLITATTGNFEAPVVWTNPTILGGKATALRVDFHQVIYLGWVIGSNPSSAEVGQDAGGNVDWWGKDNATSLPSNPFGAPSEIQSVDRVRLFCLFNDATPPTPPTLTAPPANGTNDAPTFVATFSDVDITPYGDTIERYDVQVREEGATTFVWDARDILASATEQRDKVITRPYAGPDLVGGITYEWRIRARDMAGNWSAYTAYRPYNLLDRGIVDVSTFASPTGKVEGNTAAITWSARWWHTQDLATTHVQVRVSDARGTPLAGKLSPAIPKVVGAADAPPGTDFTITAVEAALGELVDGRAHTWQIRALDTDGVWSPFSDLVAFRTNDVPSTPRLISPAEDSHSTVRPKLIAESSDTDADDVPNVDVVWDVEIEQTETGAVRTALATAYDAVHGWPSYLTTVDTVPSFGIYRWRMRGRDLSAGDYGLGAWSPWFTFRYGSGPEIVITNPAEGETQLTTTPRIDWTTDDTQSRYLVQIYQVVNNVQGPRRAIMTKYSADTFADVPSNTPLVNGVTYDVTVASWNTASTPVLGSSKPRRFLVQYGAVEGIADLTATVDEAAGDIEPTTPSLSWVISKHSQFYAYVIRRWDGPQGIATTSTVLKEITNKLQTTFFDYHAPPNTPLTYSVAQRLKNGQESAETAAELRVDLTTPVVVAVASPATLRFPVMWLGQDLQAGIRRRRSTYQTWGTGGVPTASTAPGGQKLRQVSFTIMDDPVDAENTPPWGGPASLLNDHRAAIEAVIMAGGVVSWRDEYERIFAEIADYSIRRGRLGQMEVSLQLEQVAYQEGT